MTTIEVNDGIYKLKDTGNPYEKYVVIKTYGNIRKEKKMMTIEDCKDQVAEWDDDFRKKNISFKKGCHFSNKKPGRKPLVYYVCKNETIIDSGTRDELCKRWACSKGTFNNCLHESGRKFKTKYLIKSNRKEELNCGK